MLAEADPSKGRRGWRSQLRGRLPLRTILETTSWVGFVLLMITVPVTSSPFVARFTGGSTVSPLAGLPLALLFLVWLIPSLVRDGKLPPLFKPLLLFLLAVLLSSGLAFFYEIYPTAGQEMWGRTIRALVTLAIGVGFYFVVATFMRSQTDLRRGLGWLYAGGALMLAWASLQLVFIYDGSGVHPDFQNIHRFFSIYDVPRDRVTGFAYEPSWLGDQLVILYLPLWMSSVMRGVSIFRKKPTRFSLESGLLLWGGLILFFSKSRIGLLSLIAILGVLVLGFGWQAAGRLTQAIKRQKSSPKQGLRGEPNKLLRFALWIGMLLVFVLMIYLLLSIVARFDWRMERIFGLDYFTVLTKSSQPIYTLANRLAYAERVIYWESGFQVFARHPAFGVGLGNTGFFFRETVAAYGYALPEIIRLLTGAPQFTNPKSLWVRLLAETGLLGFTLFMAWLSLLAIGAWSLRKKKGIQGLLGLAGLLALVAQLIEGFSLDTFALPHLWVILGFLTAALRVDLKGVKEPETG